MKKKYILLKESPELKIGAILEEKCDNGDQGYVCFDKKFLKLYKKSDYAFYYNRTVEKQPDWFERIECIEVPLEQAPKVRKFVKSLK